jgi:hypothetical protein
MVRYRETCERVELAFFVNEAHESLSRRTLRRLNRDARLRALTYKRVCNESRALRGETNVQS